MIYKLSSYKCIENLGEVTYLLLRYCTIEDLKNNKYINKIPLYFAEYGVDYIDLVEHFIINNEIVGLVFYVKIDSNKFSFIVEFEFLNLFSFMLEVKNENVVKCQFYGS